MTAIIRKKSLRCFMVLNIIFFSGLNLFWLYKTLYQKSNNAEKDQQNYGQAQMRSLDETNESLSLKVSTLTPASIKEESLPHKTYLTSRKRCSNKVFLLIMVLSSPYNFDRRSGIRKTWAVDQSNMSRWKTVFLIGQVMGDKVQNENLEGEENRNGDLIRGSQKDSYRNLTLKTQMGLEWASKYCDFDFLLKADDDVFVNPYKMINYLGKPDTPKTKVYMGRCRNSKIPKRRGKYGVSWEEYNKTRYPGFCNGPAYVLSSDLVHQMVEIFDLSKKVFFLEDVYIGSLVEKIGGVKIASSPLFRTIHFGNCSHYEGYFTYHKARTAHCMVQLYNLAMNERADFR